jgi:hypothetical protein
VHDGPKEVNAMSEGHEGSDSGPTGALEELTRDATSRKRFLKMMGGGVAASSTFAAVLAACGGDDDGAGMGTAAGGAGTSTQEKMSDDLQIVNYALTLEYLEADFYAKVVESGLFMGAQLELIKTIGEHEEAHVEVLTSTVEQLGGTPAEKPKTKFPLESAQSVLELAATVENLGTAAYLGQAGRIQSKDILAAALSIHTVEARHASALNTLTGKSATPDGAFAKPASMDEVLPKVKPFIVS